jgi:hypothetical protein
MPAADSEDRRFQLVLADYQSQREDERNFQYVQATALAAAIAALTVAGILVGGKPPNLVIAAIPLIPFGILAFIAMIGSLATVRSFYTRALERELQSMIESKTLYSVPGLPIASFAHLQQGLASPQTGERQPRRVALALITVVLTIFGGLAAYAVSLVQHNLVLQIAMSLAYLAGGALLIQMFVTSTIHGRALWVRLGRVSLLFGVVDARLGG